MKVHWDYGETTYVGRGRREKPNEDYAIALVKGEHLPGDCRIDALFCVADGMGSGHESHLVSERVVRDIVAFLTTSEYVTWTSARGIQPRLYLHAVKERILELNRNILAESAAKRFPMGTTLDVLFTVGDRWFLCHVGDGRVYRLAHGVIQRLTQDHSLVAALGQAGTNYAHAAVRYGRNIVTNILGVSAIAYVDVAEAELENGDIFVLCSDGVTGSLSDEEIGEIVRRSESMQEASQKLVRIANDRDGSDNLSAVCARVVSEKTRNIGE